MKVGEIVLVKFPFSDLETAKKRPALIINVVPFTTKNNLVTIAMITSKIDGISLRGDVLLEDWNEANLLFPSLLRLSKMATVDDNLIEKKMGKLSTADLKKVKRAFTTLFKFWI